MASERVPRVRRAPPTVEHMLDVLAAAAIGEIDARVDVDHDQRTHPNELLGNAINVLLGDLGQDVAQTRAGLAREEAGRARDELVALIEGELRGPREALTALEAALTTADERTRTQLERLRGSLDAVIAGLAELHELTDLERGRMVLREQPLQLRALLEDCVGRAGERAAAATIVVADDLPDTLLGDAPRLALIVDRMLATLTPATGPVELRLEVSATPAADGWHVVRIEAQAQPVPAAASEPGIGLAIARGLAGALGGQLVLDQQAGTATLIAPLAERSAV